MRAAVLGGRAGFRRRRSHDVVVVDSCLVTHPAAEEVLVEGRFGDADEVVVRVGARTGDRLVVASPTATGVVVPDDVRVVGTDELDAGAEAWVHEEIAGRTWRVSARSFLQASPEAADALVDRVGAAAADLVPGAERLVDLCAGVGLFAGTVGAEASEVVAVESSRDAVADARHNLAGGPARVVRAPMARWRPDPADLVIADPPRTGLGREGVAPVLASGAAGVVLVSCDAGALGRDARLLVEGGLTFAGRRGARPLPPDLARGGRLPVPSVSGPDRPSLLRGGGGRGLPGHRRWTGPGGVVDHAGVPPDAAEPMRPRWRAEPSPARLPLDAPPTRRGAPTSPGGLQRGRARLRRPRHRLPGPDRRRPRLPGGVLRVGLSPLPLGGPRRLIRRGPDVPVASQATR